MLKKISSIVVESVILVCAFINVAQAASPSSQGRLEITSAYFKGDVIKVNIRNSSYVDGLPYSFSSGSLEHSCNPTSSGWTDLSGSINGYENDFFSLAFDETIEATIRDNCVNNYFRYSDGTVEALGGAAIRPSTEPNLGNRVAFHEQISLVPNGANFSGEIQRSLSVTSGGTTVYSESGIVHTGSVTIEPGPPYVDGTTYDTTIYTYTNAALCNVPGVAPCNGRIFNGMRRVYTHPIFGERVLENTVTSVEIEFTSYITSPYLSGPDANASHSFFDPAGWVGGDASVVLQGHDTVLIDNDDFTLPPPQHALQPLELNNAGRLRFEGYQYYSGADVTPFDLACSFSWSDDGNTLYYGEGTDCVQASVELEVCSDDMLMVGNPIDCALGKKTQIEVDYPGYDDDPLSISRVFTSNQANGGEWNFVFSTRAPKLDAKDDGNILIIDFENGNKMAFARTEFQQVWQSVSDAHGRVTLGTAVSPEPDYYPAYVYESLDGTEYYFDRTNFRLLHIYRPRLALNNELSHWYEYLSNGQIDAIANKFEREVYFTYDVNGRLETITDPAGGVYTYSYDSMGRLISVVKPDLTPGDSTDNPERIYHYEDTSFPFALTGITDELGNRLSTYGYDDLGRAESTQLAGGVDSTTIEYLDSTTSRVTQQLSSTQSDIKTYTFIKVNGATKVSSVTQQACDTCPVQTATYEYDTNGFLDAYIDFRGNRTEYDFDEYGRQTEVREAFGTIIQKTTTTTWWDNLSFPRTRQVGDLQVEYSHPTHNQYQIIRTDLNSGEARRTLYSFNSNDQLSYVDGPRTDVQDRIDYNYYGSPTHDLYSITQRGGATQEITTFLSYNEHGQPLTYREANGLDIEVEYDAEGRIVATRETLDDSIVRETLTPRNKAGLLESITLPDLGPTTFFYDNAQRLEAITNGENEREEYDLDLLGNLTKLKKFDASLTQAFERESRFDSLSRRTKSIDLNDQELSLEYDANGNQTIILDEEFNEDEQKWDELNRLSSVEDHDDYEVIYGYDDLDNIVGIQDQRSIATTYAFNAFSDMTGLTSNDTGSEVLTPDAAGNIDLLVHSESGQTKDYSYDGRNRLLSIEFPADTSKNITFTYDETTGNINGIGRLTTISNSSGSIQFEYDEAGNILKRTQTIGTTPYETEYEYTNFDKIKKTVYPTGRIVDYSYDDAGRVSKITTRSNQFADEVVVVENVQYMPHGPVETFRYGNGLVRNNDYDSNYKLTGTTDFGINLTYGYFDNDNIETITDLYNTYSQSFQYDSQDRLTYAEGDYGQHSYTYDGVGNRLSATKVTVSETLIETYTPELASNRLSSVNYDDGSGSITRSFTYTQKGDVETDIRPGRLLDYTYDERDRLIDVEVDGLSAASYEYNGMGQRVAKTLPSGSVTHYVYNLDGNVIAELDSNQKVAEYIYFDGKPISLVRSDYVASTTQEVVDWSIAVNNHRSDYAVTDIQDGKSAFALVHNNFLTPEIEIRVPTLGGWNIVPRIFPDFPIYGLKIASNSRGDIVLLYTNSSSQGVYLRYYSVFYGWQDQVQLSSANYVDGDVIVDTAGTAYIYWDEKDASYPYLRRGRIASYNRIDGVTQDQQIYSTAYDYRRKLVAMYMDSSENVIFTTQKESAYDEDDLLLNTYSNAGGLGIFEYESQIRIDDYTAVTGSFTNDGNGMIVALNIASGGGAIESQVYERVEGSWIPQPPVIWPTGYFPSAPQIVFKNGNATLLTMLNGPSGKQYSLAHWDGDGWGNNVELDYQPFGPVFSVGKMELAIDDTGATTIVENAQVSRTVFSPGGFGGYFDLYAHVFDPSLETVSSSILTEGYFNQNFALAEDYNDDPYIFAWSQNGDRLLGFDMENFGDSTALVSDSFFYHNDHLGTPLKLSSILRDLEWHATYDPFGEATILVENVVQNLRFPGQYYDEESGLHYNYYRDYDPTLGRYIQSDPIGLQGGVNAYAYVGNNPLVRFDFFGLDWEYSQSTGNLTYVDNAGNRSNVATGYSGGGWGVNEPSAQEFSNVGPIPEGTYDIGNQTNSRRTGSGVLPLSPRTGTITFGRHSFQIHGDNRFGNETASQGCIILPRNVRDQIANSNDNTLIVVP